MKISQETISPTMAAEWLATSPGNRTLSHHRVTALVEAIRSGRWHCSPDAIAFGAGRLANGHHRLTACVEADKPIVAFVVWADSSEASEGWRLATDAGRPRSLTDQTACLGGEQIPKAVVSALAVVVRRGESSGVLPRAEIMALWHQHRDTVLALARGAKNSPAYRAPVTGACIRAVLSGSITLAQSQRFLALLANPSAVADPAKESAPLAMLSAAQRSRRIGAGTKHPGGAEQATLYLLTCAALVKFAAGDQCARLRPMAACPFHVPEIDGATP